MLKFALSAILFALAVTFSGCVSKTDGSAMETAIRLYDGRIEESVWLEMIGAESEKIPNTDYYSVRLADGFLFYTTEDADGVKMVCDVVVPANGDANLKQLAKSLRRNVPEDMNFLIREDGVVLGERLFTDADFFVFLKENAATPAAKRHQIFLTLAHDVSATRILKIQELLKSLGQEKTPISVEEPRLSADK